MLHACSLEMVCGNKNGFLFLDFYFILILMCSKKVIFKIDDIFEATTLGADIEAQNGKNSDYVEALGKCVEITTE